MGYKTLELSLISAKDLKSVNLIGKMDVYVVVSLCGYPVTKKKTPVHQGGGTSPCWNNHTLTFTFDEAAAVNAGWSVVFQLKHRRTFGWDKDVGRVRVPVKDLLGNKEAETATCLLRRPSGEIKGELEFSYTASDAVHRPKAARPQTVYPYGGYLPPQQKPGYPQKNDGFGMGLISGVLGGLLIDEVVSDDGY